MRRGNFSFPLVSFQPTCNCWQKYQYKLSLLHRLLISLLKFWHSLFISAIFAIHHKSVFSQELNFSKDARTIGIGGASVSQRGLWSILNNQAGISKITKPIWGISGNNHFLTPQLSTSSIVYAHPTKKGTIGLSAQYYGYRHFRESEYSISIGKTLSTKISTGVQISYISTSISDGNSDLNNIVAEGGILISVSDKLIIGTHIYNPFYGKKRNSKHRATPSIIRLGSQYIFSDKVTFYTEIEKSIQSMHKAKMGLTYQPNQTFDFSVGISTNPTLVSFVIGIQQKKLHFDFSFSQHQILGTSPHIALNYAF